MTSRRVGVFGGTFDPPHLGHTSVASEVADALGLDTVVWIPAGRPPHKDPSAVTPASVRLRMTRAAAEADPRFVVSDVEVRREGPSYMIDTLRALADPEAELFLIMGVDQFRTLDTWKDPRTLRSLATLVVMDREGDAVDPSARDGEVVRVPVTRVDISSSDVRSAVSEGRDLAPLVPPGVARVVEHEGLYGGRRAPR